MSVYVQGKKVLRGVMSALSELNGNRRASKNGQTGGKEQMDGKGRRQKKW